MAFFTSVWPLERRSLRGGVTVEVDHSLLPIAVRPRPFTNEERASCLVTGTLSTRCHKRKTVPMSGSVNTRRERESSGLSGKVQTILKMDLSEERPDFESPSTRDHLSFSVDRILAPDFGPRKDQRASATIQSCFDPFLWAEENPSFHTLLKYGLGKSSECLSIFRYAHSPFSPGEEKSLYVNVHSPTLQYTKDCCSPSTYLKVETDSSSVSNDSNNLVQSLFVPCPKDLEEYHAGLMSLKADIIKLKRSHDSIQNPDSVPENKKDISQYAIPCSNASASSPESLASDGGNDFRLSPNSISSPSSKKDIKKLVPAFENRIYSSSTSGARFDSVVSRTHGLTFPAPQDNQKESSSMEEKRTLQLCKEKQNKDQDNDRCSPNESRCSILPDTKSPVKGSDLNLPQMKESEITNCENKSPSPVSSSKAPFLKPTSLTGIKRKSPLLEQLKPDVKSDVHLTGDEAWPVWVYCSRYSPRPSSGKYFSFHISPHT
ncbi:hypothetical protein TNIN_139371 [Trichonephila inaurata madagascariensis]|uniref:Uncharacterized protein n=1 Tax=Trichonephila inaurata madagascariensis TaxID=2747483 RepID=A0A8X6YB09_9ARAC|nr:hypothetical protein TNIN_139371 [Trichonephila inaurata madagascariensis]